MYIISAIDYNGRMPIGVNYLMKKFAYLDIIDI